MVKIVKEAGIPSWAGRLVNQLNVALPAVTTEATVNFAGDASGSLFFNGQGNFTANLTLGNVTTDVGTFGNATTVAQVTANGKGLLTSVGNVAISLPLGVALTGDATGSTTGTAPGNLSVGITLATANASPGTFGNASSVAQVTVDGKGRVTTATSVSIALPSTTVAALPAASASTGRQFLVTDSSTATFNAIPSASGANIVTVFSNGTTWRVG